MLSYNHVPEKRLSANLNSKLLFPTPKNRTDNNEIVNTQLSYEELLHIEVLAYTHIVCDAHLT